MCHGGYQILNIERWSGDVGLLPNMTLELKRALCGSMGSVSIILDSY